METRAGREAGRSWFYLWGFVTGLVVSALLVSGMVGAVRRQGIRFHVDTAPIAAQVEQEVKAAVRKEVPATINQLKAQLPARVAAQTVQHLSQVRLQIAGFSVPVPEAAATQIQTGIEQALKSGLDLAVTQQDTNALADRLSKQAGAMVQQKLVTYLKDRTFDVELWKGFTIPVTVIPN